MQYTILLLTILFALSQSQFTIDFSAGINFDISAEIGAVLDQGLSIGTDVAAILANSVATVSSDLTVNGALTIGTLINAPVLRIGGNATVVVDSLVFTNGDIEMEDGASLMIVGDASFDADATLSSTLSIGGEIEVNSGAAVYIEGEADLDDVVVAADATLEITADAAATVSGSVSLAAGAVLETSGSITITGDVSGSGSIHFSAESETSSSVNSETVQGSIVASGSAFVKFGSSTTTTVTSNLSVEGSASIKIEAGTSITVEGDASFESESTYQVTILSDDSDDVMTVEGEANLDGTLVIDSDIEITADADIAIMYYGSLAEGSAFASISVTSSKRALSADEYEVEYQEDKAVIRASSNTDSSALLSVGSAVLLLSLF